MGEKAGSNRGIVLTLAAVATVVAVIRYFLRGWLEPLGVPTVIGSFLASVTIVLVVGLTVLFLNEGRQSTGRYLRAAAWFAALAAWCEILVVTGILITERTGARTYYQGPWEMVERTFPTPAAHALGHSQGFGPRLAIALIIGAIIYWLAKRTRSRRQQSVGRGA